MLSSDARPIDHNLRYAPIILLLAVLASGVALRFDVRRQVFVSQMNDVPVLLALFFLSPEIAIAVRLIAGLTYQVFKRIGPHKVAFNTAGHIAGVAAANLVVFELGIGAASSPRTWLVLAAAIVAENLVTVAGVA